MFNENSINGWCVSTDPLQYERNIKKQYNDFRVNFCTSCEKAYEYYHRFGCGSILIYHDDFPTYKIERKVCGNCG